MASDTGAEDVDDVPADNSSASHTILDVQEPEPSPEDRHGNGRTRTQNIAIMLALCSSLFLTALDFAITSTALPTISDQFHSSSGYVWVGSGYLLSFAASCPIWGKLSDIWGRKPMFLIAIAIFSLGSLLCAIATGVKMLIAGRVVQGLGAGGINVLTNICVSDLFSVRHRGVYLGLLGLVHATAGALGPVLGGIFSQVLSWRWCFYINLPISGIAFVIIIIYLDLKTPKTPLIAGLRAIDWLGSMTIIGVVMMTLLGLDFGGVTFPWNSPKVICLIVFGLALLAVFLVIEAKVAKYPLVPLRIFRKQSNIAVFVFVACHGFTYVAGIYYLPLYFQAVRGSSPLDSGLLLIPFAVTTSLGNVVTGLYTRKTGRYIEPIRIGMLLITLGFGLFIDLKSSTSLVVVIIFSLIGGFGIGPGFQSPLIALQSLIRPAEIGTATSTLGLIRNIATSISVVIGGVVFDHGMEVQNPMLQQILGPPLAAQFTGSSAEANVMLVGTLPTAAQIATVREVYAKSLQDMWILYTCVAALGVLSSLFIRQNELSSVYVETKTGLDVLKERGP